MSLSPFTVRSLNSVVVAWGVLAGTAVAQTTLPAPTADVADGVTEMDRFIATESAASVAGDLLPTSRPSDSVFGDARAVLDIPRSVTVLTPALLEKFGVRDFNDLARVTAGGAQANLYGVPGVPQLRGDIAGIFFNGMQRAYQRNEMPTSFGSLEGMDLVKGPAPGNFGATQAGGYVNFLPKSPYYDRLRSVVRVTIGTGDYTNAQLDTGGPFLLAGNPAAFRVSLTAQNAGLYYDNVKNDYVSLYTALKTRLSPTLSVFSGAEYYRFKSNENAGWNRVTQDLIDHGNYIVGDVPVATSAAAGGNVLPSDVPFVLMPATAGETPVAFGPTPAIVPPAAFVATLTPAQRALLGPDGEYTAAYLNAGGPVATAKISARTALADPADYANSQNLLYFFDLLSERSPDTTLKNQTLIEWIETDKLSSYGYAFAMEQFVLENKTTVTRTFTGRLSRLTYGGSLRYVSAHQLQDFAAEPFSRRDLTAATISPNSIVLAGAQRPLSGDTRNLWSQGTDSDTYSGAIFAVADLRVTERLSAFVTARGEHTRFTASVPWEFERSPDRGREFADDEKTYGVIGINPLFKLTPTVALFAAAQLGTAVNPSQAGTISSADNFGPTKLLETGAKVSLLDGKLFASLAAYHSSLSLFNSLVDAPYSLRTRGVELETTWMITDRLSLIANVDGHRTVQPTMPGFRYQAAQEYYVPLVAGGLYAGGPANDELIATNNPDHVFPGTPQFTANLFASYEFASGFGVAVGPTFRGSYWHNYEHTLHLPSSQIWNANLSYRRGSITVLLELTNLFDEDFFRGSDPLFAANTIITKAPPLEGKLNVTYRF